MASDLVRGPKWRTRTSAARRHVAAAITFASVVAFGLAVMWGCIRVLQWLAAPGWLGWSLWIAPTVGVGAWTVLRPRVAGLSDDDDDSWFGYSIRWVLVGELEPRPAPQRLAVAVLFGAPVVWAVLVLGLLTIVGLV